MTDQQLTMNRGATKFRYVYEALLMRLISSRSVDVNARTGREVKMLPCPAHFNLDLSKGELPTCGIRKTYPATAAAEVAWFLMGTQDVSFIRQYAPIWDKFVEADGQTVEAAYGYRWKQHFDRDQLWDAVGALVKDPSDRRVWVQAWDPSSDGLGRAGQKNVPCPIGFTLSIVPVQGRMRLNSSLFIRSSDVFVGLPYDVMGHALLMDAICESLNQHHVGEHRLLLGTMGVTLAHPHLYEAHYEMAEEALGSMPCDETMALPRLKLEYILDRPHDYVAEVKRLAQGVEAQPAYSCRPEVVA